MQCYARETLAYLPSEIWIQDIVRVQLTGKTYEDHGKMAKEEQSKAKLGLSYRESNMHHFFASIDRQKANEKRVVYDTLPG